MNKSLNIIILPTIFICGIVTGLFIALNSLQSNRVVSTTSNSATKEKPQLSNGAVFPEKVDIPENIFDAVETLPSTTLSLKYPQGGFNGYPYDISRTPVENDEMDTNFLNRLSFYSSTNVSSTGFAPIEISVAAYKKEGDETLQKLFSDKKIPAKYGTFVTINGHEYYLTKSNQGKAYSVWNAISVGEKELVKLSFGFSHGIDPFSYSAYRNDDLLFFQFLSHINFK